MAKNIGAVRFQDGDIRYFVYNGMVDIARPRLFETEEAACDAWDDTQSADFELRLKVPVGELVDVMPFYGFGDREVCFVSTANKCAAYITGKLADHI